MLSVARQDSPPGLGEARRRAGDPAARERLVAAYAPLVRRLSRRFLGSGESPQDLYQMGVLGLLRAADGFDPRRGTSFASLAIPAITGAILNHLRDHGSLLKVPRELRRRMPLVGRTTEGLAQALGRWPTPAEVAAASGLTAGQVAEALLCNRAGSPCSLSAPVDGHRGDPPTTLSEVLGEEEDGFRICLERLTLAAALRSLSARERRVVTLRYYRGLSQQQVAGRVGVSQMHVSRLERAALAKLRTLLEAPPLGGARASTHAHPLPNAS